MSILKYAQRMLTRQNCYPVHTKGVSSLTFTKALTDRVPYILLPPFKNSNEIIKSGVMC